MMKDDDATEWDDKGPSHSKITLNNYIKHVKNMSILLKDHKSYRLAVQLITGTITGLNYHLHKIEKADSANCDAYMAEKTVSHFRKKYLR